MAREVSGGGEMKKTRVMVPTAFTVREEQRRLLAALSEVEGRSRSTYVREALDLLMRRRAAVSDRCAEDAVKTEEATA